MPTLDGLRRYAVIGPGGDETTLMLCLEAAAAWFKGAGVPPPAADNPLYDMGVYMLALHYYDQRGATAGKSDTTELPYGVMSIMHQLRY